MSVPVLGLSVCVLLAAAIGGCDHQEDSVSSPEATSTASDSPASLPSAAERREAIYELATHGLDRVDLFFAPRDPSRDQVNLAPILVQEVGEKREDDSAAATLDHPTGKSDTSPPAVLYRETSARLDGRLRRQLVYLWRYRTADGDDSRSVQGLRVTLDSTGYPAIIEVLAKQRGLRVIYVGPRLEQRAREEHGEPLRGRRHAIEGSVDKYPEVVVASVLGEGPMSLGPFVYLRRRSREVLTLLCRCSASRIGEPRESLIYELVEAEVPAVEAGVPAVEDEVSALEAEVATIEAEVSAIEAALLGEDLDVAWLEKALRLPADF